MPAPNPQLKGLSLGPAYSVTLFCWNEWQLISFHYRKMSCHFDSIKMTSLLSRVGEQSVSSHQAVVGSSSQSGLA
jgi:hypothetical protein